MRILWGTALIYSLFLLSSNAFSSESLLPRTTEKENIKFGIKILKHRKHKVTDYSHIYGKKRTKLFLGNLKEPEVYFMSPKGYRILLEEREGCCFSAYLFLNVNKTISLDDFNTAEVKQEMFKSYNCWTYINITFPVYKGTRFNFVIIFDISNQYEKLFVKKLYNVEIQEGLSDSEKYFIR